MVLNPEKKFFFENFKAVKIRPIIKSLATPTNLSTAGTVAVYVMLLGNHPSRSLYKTRE